MASVEHPGKEAIRGSGLEPAKEGNRPVVRVCLGPGCLARGADKVAEAFRKTLRARKIPIEVAPLIKETGCDGFCKMGPIVKLAPLDLYYTNVDPGDVEEIVQKSLVEGETIERLLYGENGARYMSRSEIPFFKAQQKLVTRNLGLIDPLDIEDALKSGAYSALRLALAEMTPEDVIREVEVSGLRGRGGAGFPTGRKWRSAVSALKKNPGPVYVVCNGDEGDPGAFMDRAIMEGDPHAVLEGMILGAYGVGAQQGFLYVRAEYPIAIRSLEKAMDQAREKGFLGEDIQGTGFSFDMRINRGAGAFVCGESTALFTSIEGRAGEPRAKYVRSVERGLWERPTVLNNVETWANVPLIIQRGGKWFAGIGSAHSTGTKVFSLVGKVRNVGLVEVPMGVPLSEIVETIGGGLQEESALKLPSATCGESSTSRGSSICLDSLASPSNLLGMRPLFRFKAVQTGGPSGGCIPYALKDVPVDYDSLSKAGSMMGSGGMIVMDHRDCVVDVSRYFLRFLQEESCGKCLPCRLGLKYMLEYLDRFARGEGSLEDIDQLESMAKAVQDGSLCALGGSAPNPVLTTLRYFRDEYIAHIVEKRCPAGVCKDLITYAIDPEKCTGCGLCAKNCPQGCISGEKKNPHKIDQAACIRCGMCMDSCKFTAITAK